MIPRRRTVEPARLSICIACVDLFVYLSDFIGIFIEHDWTCRLWSFFTLAPAIVLACLVLTSAVCDCSSRFLTHKGHWQSPSRSSGVTWEGARLMLLTFPHATQPTPYSPYSWRSNISHLIIALCPISIFEETMITTSGFIFMYFLSMPSDPILDPRQSTGTRKSCAASIPGIVPNPILAMLLWFPRSNAGS